MAQHAGLGQIGELLRPWGEIVILGGRTLRLTPYEISYPTIYFNRGGSIDMLIPEGDLFYQKDCLEVLEQWLGEPVSTLE